MSEKATPRENKVPVSRVKDGKLIADDIIAESGALEVALRLTWEEDVRENAKLAKGDYPSSRKPTQFLYSDDGGLF